MPFWALKDPHSGAETGLLDHRLGGEGGQGAAGGDVRGRGGKGRKALLEKQEIK